MMFPALSSKTKYVLFPGEITSATDGDRHRVGAGQLVHLYGVDPRECIVFDPPQGWPDSLIESALREHSRLGLIALYPRTDGRYTLPAPAPQTDRGDG